LTTLADIRDQIDDLDDRVIELLKERLDLVISTLEKKDRIEDLKREDQIVAKLKKNSGNEDEEEYLKEIYKVIFKEGKRIQNMKNIRKQNEQEKL